MRSLWIILIISLLSLFWVSGKPCLFAQGEDSDLLPSRLAIIKGKATLTNHPIHGETSYSGVLIFQKVGCDCFVGVHPDANGNYKISVGDGKYKIIVRNPSSPEFDMLTADQEKFIDTETDEAKKFSKQEFNFDIKIRLPK
jgi:hypothetical protein